MFRGKPLPAEAFSINTSNLGSDPGQLVFTDDHSPLTLTSNVGQSVLPLREKRKTKETRALEGSDNDGNINLAAAGGKGGREFKASRNLDVLGNDEMLSPSQSRSKISKKSDEANSMYNSGVGKSRTSLLADVAEFVGDAYSTKTHTSSSHSETIGPISVVEFIEKRLESLGPVDWSSWSKFPTSLGTFSSLLIDWERVLILFKSMYNNTFSVVGDGHKGSKKAHFDCIERGDNNFNTFDGIKGESWGMLLVLDALMFNVNFNDKDAHSSWQRRTFNQHDILRQCVIMVCAEAVKAHKGPVVNVQVRITGNEWVSYATMIELLPTLKTSSKSSGRYTTICKMLTDVNKVGMELPHVIIATVVRAMERLVRFDPSKFFYLCKDGKHKGGSSKPVAYVLGGKVEDDWIVGSGGKNETGARVGSAASASDATDSSLKSGTRSKSGVSNPAPPTSGRFPP